MSSFLRSVGDFFHAIRDHAWTASEIAAGWRPEAPVLVDLLGGGRRKGLNEAPDCFYSLTFLLLGPGRSYELRLPETKAFYTVVTLHSPDDQSSLELVSDDGEAGLAGRTVTLAPGAAAPGGLDTAPYRGLTQIMVRQYCRSIEDASERPFPQLRAVSPDGGPVAAARRLPHALVAGFYFFRWRLKALLGLKYLLTRLGGRVPKNTFLSFEEVLSIWHGGPEVVTRLAVRDFKYVFCIYELGEDEVLRVRYGPGTGRYFSYSLVNLGGLQGLDHYRRPTYCNSFQLTPDAEGVYTVDVGPQAGNGAPWMDTTGYRRGVLGFREILPADGGSRPVCTVAPAG